MPWLITMLIFLGKLELGQLTDAAEDPVGPMMPPGRDCMVRHEGLQQRGMLLFLPDQQLRDPGHLGGVVLLGESIGRAQQIAAGGLLPELKSRNGGGD